MKTDFMRDMDERLGGLCISILKIVTFNPLRSKPDPSRLKNVKNIVFIKFFGAGSILLATPMIRGLKKVYGDANICMLTFEENYEACSYLGTFEKILTIRKHSFLVFVRDTISALIELRKVRPDIVIDGEFFSNYTSLISWFSGSKVRVGFHERQISRGDIITYPVSLNVHKHVTSVFYSLAVAVGAKYEDANLSQLSLPIPSAEEVAATFLKISVNSKSPVVVLNPNAGPMSHLRRWPAEYFTELTLALIQKYPEFTFVFVGSKEEASYVSGITGGISSSKVVNSAGMLSFLDLCAVISKAKLVITNDSMPLHLASAYNKDVVCFFGPETPKFYGPLQSNSLVYFEDIPCSPCLMTWDNKTGKECNDNICLKQVSPTRVARDIEGWLVSK